MIVQEGKGMESMSGTSDMESFVLLQAEKGAEEIFKEIKLYRNLYTCTHLFDIFE